MLSIFNGTTPDTLSYVLFKGYSNTYEAPERYAQIQHGYIPVTDQEDKYKRKNPIEFVRRWYRYDTCI